jgi:hypothetical protein
MGSQQCPMGLALAACTGKRATFSLQRRTIRYCCLLVAVTAQSSSSSSRSPTPGAPLPSSSLPPLKATTAVVQAHSIDYAFIRARCSPRKLQGASCFGNRQRQGVIGDKGRLHSTTQRLVPPPLHALPQLPSFFELQASSDNNQQDEADDDDLERWEALYQQGKSNRLVLRACVCV